MGLVMERDMGVPPLMGFDAAMMKAWHAKATTPRRVISCTAWSKTRLEQPTDPRELYNNLRDSPASVLLSNDVNTVELERAILAPWSVVSRG